MNRYIHSRSLRWIINMMWVFLLIMTLLRVVFFWIFEPVNVSWHTMGPAFIMGLRYDFRIISFVMLLLLIIGSFRRFNPFESVIAKKCMFGSLAAFCIVFTFFYVLDFLHFAYLSQRLNASILNYLQDTRISLRMAWQSYPLVKILIVFAIASWLLFRVVRKLYKSAAVTPPVIKRANCTVCSILLSILLMIGIFGRVGQFPLRWSDAFSLGNDFSANIALNPFQVFLSTLKFRGSEVDMRKVKKYYPVMAEQLEIQLQDSASLKYARTYIANNALRGAKPNIVLVICESFSAYKSSMWGNPLNTTPYFNELCKNGLFFNRCFSPAYGTARGIWALITGIPDVEVKKTASRNPSMVSQRTIINDFKGYEKIYFLGGSASWANIRGLLMNNIKDLRLYEEGDYSAGKIDVWGISDKNLFLEANQVLKKQNRPFFAIIQTADNHRPYSIPNEDLKEFKRITFPTDTLKTYGFENNEEMNAFRHTDFCFQKFIEAAKKESYFDNTIFVFVGDHGIRGNAFNMFPTVWTEEGLTCEHVPLLFYSPRYIKPELINNISSQIDILPSLAAFAGIAYCNNTLGRNLFDSTTRHNPADLRNHAFIIDHDDQQIGLVTNEYFFVQSLSSGKEQMYSIVDGHALTNSPKEQLMKDSSRMITNALFETSQYLLLNNKQK